LPGQIRLEEIKPRVTPVDELVRVEVSERGSVQPRHLLVSKTMESVAASRLVEFLRGESDIFAWDAGDIGRVSPELIVHKLNVDLTRMPVKQRRRQFAPSRQEAISEEVSRLLGTGFIREVLYPEWLANVVLVEKANGKWRMCVDFTDLNKACPKDCYPLPRIDQLVDATSGHEVLSFLDAFSGYHQIQMAVEDQEKTAFITAQGTYCYNVMPFD